MGSLKRMAVLCGFTVLFAATAQAEDWQVAKDEDGIKVSLSEIAGSKYKAYRGVALIKAPVAKIQALQEDVAGASVANYETDYTDAMESIEVVDPMFMLSLVGCYSTLDSSPSASSDDG